MVPTFKVYKDYISNIKLINSNKCTELNQGLKLYIIDVQINSIWPWKK